MPHLSSTSSEPERAAPDDGPTEQLGLVLAWSAEEPDRAGEVALIPGGTPGHLLVLGRGVSSGGEEHGRVSFARLRGTRIESRPPIVSRSLSRVQLQIRVGEDGNQIEVENVGRLGLEMGGVPGRRFLARPGDVLQLGGQFLFLVVRRPLGSSEPKDHRAIDFPFGFADRSGIVGESRAAWALREKIAFVGPRVGHVLIVGASGTGKELVAQAVHAASERSARVLRARNAATIPEGIVDAELFGNARNYPNPGVAERGGLVGDADGTSLFLDEFGELPVVVQAHLLRVLDSGEYQRLGESRIRRSDFRLIAVTNRTLSALKEDVLARLTFRIDVPDLNERKEDVPLLARHFLRRMLAEDPALASRFRTADGEIVVPSLSVRFVRDLLSRDYTTHAREIETILWQAIETSGAGLIDAVPGATAETTGRASPQTAPTLPTPPDNASRRLEADAIQRCLDAHNGVLEDTWRELGLSSRYALIRLIRKHGIEIRKRPTR